MEKWNSHLDPATEKRKKTVSLVKKHIKAQMLVGSIPLMEELLTHLTLCRWSRRRSDFLKQRCVSWDSIWAVGELRDLAWRCPMKKAIQRAILRCCSIVKARLWFPVEGALRVIGGLWCPLVQCAKIYSRERLSGQIGMCSSFSYYSSFIFPSSTVRKPQRWGGDRWVPALTVTSEGFHSWKW